MTNATEHNESSSIAADALPVLEQQADATSAALLRRRSKHLPGAMTLAREMLQSTLLRRRQPAHR